MMHQAGAGAHPAQKALLQPAIIGHIGDSRCYRWRDGALERLTDDHSLVEQMVRQGQLTEQQALNHPQRSIITRALGPESVVEPDAQTVGARDGDLLLLCSDGLTTMISDEQIAAMLARDEPLKATTRALIAAANEAGGRDNITVVLIRLEVLGDAAAREIEATQVGLDVGQLPVAKATAGEAAVAASVERRASGLHLFAQRCLAMFHPHIIKI